MARSRPGRVKPRQGSTAADGDDSEHGLYVASVEKAFRVLEALNRAGRPLGLSALTPMTGFGRSATQRFLFTLRALNYVSQDPATKSYSLSPKMLEFGRAYLSADFMREQARPFLDAANRESRETVNLTVLDREDVVYVLRFPSQHAVSVDLAVGSRLPAYCTAPGRAILAYLEERETNAILENSVREKRTPQTVTGKAALLKILRDVREQGFCINNEEAFVGDMSIASPVFGHTGQVLAAVNVAVPTPRWTVSQAKRELVPIVMKAARQISETLATQMAGK